MKNLKLTFLVWAAALIGLSACSKEDFFDFLKDKPGEDKPAGMVFTTTNAMDGNEVVAYDRGKDGMIEEAGRYYTGGMGTAGSLGSQNAVMWAASKKLLFVVNAGSNDISVFSAKGGGLTLVDKVSSEGEMPISLSYHGKYLYVVNAGGSGSIAGFLIGDSGKLTYIPDSRQYLSNEGEGDATGPAQIEFTPDGSWLVVTEKPTNQILLYRVGNDGKAHPPVVNTSAGETPFGFYFTKTGLLAVSEAFGGAENASVLSTYKLHEDGTISVISDQVPTHQTAACWAIITDNQKYVYTTNTGSGSVSSFSLATDGSVELLESVAGFNGLDTSPIDMALSHNSKFMYALNRSSGSISVYQVKADGSLAEVETMSGLPMGAAGIAAQ